jgi:nicotinamidase-related amidase
MAFRLDRPKVGLMIIDVQDRLYSHVERSCEVLIEIQKIIKGCQALNVPIIVTEQYPEKMGATVMPIRTLLPDDQEYLSKTSFSCCGNDVIKQKILSLPIQQWILIGIEAHVCVLQTAIDLVEIGKQVVVLNDAITSRSIYDFSTAIAEMRDFGVRISSVETVLFELLKNSKAPEFKAVSQLIK